MADGPIHRLPVTTTFERRHGLSKDCWCKPMVLTVNGTVKEISHKKQGK